MNTTNTDFILIENAEYLARVGETKEERGFPQVLTVSIHLYLPLNIAAKSDNLEQTVNYALVSTDIESLLREETFSLIETVAERMASLLLGKYPLLRVKVRVGKKSFPGIQSISVNIERWTNKTDDHS